LERKAKAEIYSGPALFVVAGLVLNSQVGVYRNGEGEI
jgi:hypothetical protein